MATPAQNETSHDEARDTARDANGIQVIARAAAILRELADATGNGARGGLSLGKLAQATGLPRSTVQRIVAALAKEGLVASSGQRSGAIIGPGLERLAAASGTSTVEKIAPHLRNLGAAVGETVDLAILAGGSVEFVDQVPGQQRLVALSAIGERFPLHCTANGKAILTCFPPDDVEDLLDKSIAEHREFASFDKNALREEIERGRKTGLTYDMGEHGEGINAIGTALRDGQGRPIAISIPVPERRFAAQQHTLEQALLKFRSDIKKIIA